MSVMKTIRARHSVREYEAGPLEEGVRERLQTVIDECARQSGLDIQLVTDNPEAFQIVGGIGLVRGAEAHIDFVAEGSASDEAIGYWGQRIVLAAQEMGLNTCWVAMMARKKSKAKLRSGASVRLGIAVGRGKTNGSPRRTKSVDALSVVECGEAPAWFAVAMEAAQLAPTAINGQHFRITLRADGRTVKAEATKKRGWCTVDLGIVKRNFEEAANESGADWVWE